MKREYDFSKAKRGPLRNLPPMSEVDRHTKVRITIMLDLDLLKFFKSRAASRGAQPYQTQINQALREYVAAHRPNPGGDADHHGAFETADDRGREACAVGAVGHAVVERQRQRQQQPRLDPALAYDGLLPGAGDAEDRDLRIVDDRDGAGAAEGADVGDREGATAQVVERRLALAHALGQRAQLARHVEHRLLVDVAQHGHDQTALGGDGDAEVDVALDDQLPGGGVEGRVERRVLAERLRGRLQEKSRQRQGHAARLHRLEIALDDRVELRDVRAVEVRDVGDHRRR